MCIETYGCTMNQGEGLEFQRIISELGHEVVSDTDEAEIVVLNTCTVIKATENRMIRRLRELSKCGKEIIVTGCMAKVQPEVIAAAAPTSKIITFDRYHAFKSLFEGWYGRGHSLPIPDSEITEIVPIAQGCLGGCTYCITRLARGRLKSIPQSIIVERCSRAIRRGCREILLTAQDTASYGLERGENLGQLIEKICKLDGNFMVRVGMMNPDSLLRILDDYRSAWKKENVYKFLHLPVQSGSDRILELMGRRYTASQFMSLVETFREEFPDMTLSTDVILGFPGEEEEDFEATVELIEKIRPNILNITRFSPRPGTPAYRMKGAQPGWKIKEWSRQLTKLRFDIADRINREYIGRIEKALVTEHGKDGDYICRTRNYWPVVIKEKVRLGDFVTVELIDSTPTHFFGRLCEAVEVICES